jgi:hypothetical protein
MDFFPWPPLVISLPVPELTRSAGIQLNERLSLRARLDSRYRGRSRTMPAAFRAARPSGHHIPPLGFVFYFEQVFGFKSRF